MTENEKVDKRIVGNNYSRLVLIAILMSCLCIVGFIFAQSFGGYDFATLLQNPLLIPAIAIQVAASLLFVLAWKILLYSHTEQRFSFRECAAQIGITLLGKYLPGKIWGLVGRTYLLNKRKVSKSEAINLLITDQFITFFTGILVGTVALCAFYSVQIAITLAVLFLLIIPSITKYYRTIMGHLVHVLSRWLGKVSSSVELQGFEISRNLLIGSTFIYLLHWLATATVLILLFYPLISNDLLTNSSLFIAAIPLAMLTGFLAIWAPGGVVVREAVIVGILMLNLSVDVALAVALSYRLICILIDLCFGAFTLIYYSYIVPELARHQP